MRAGPREVVFNMHFNKQPGPGTALCTNIQAGIRFKEDGEVIRFVTGGNQLRIRGFEIPPGEPSYSASMEYTFDEDVELMSFMPHMHLRGKAALYEITYPDGRHETLLHVPEVRFPTGSTRTSSRTARSFPRARCYGSRSGGTTPRTTRTTRTPRRALRGDCRRTPRCHRAT